MRTTALIVLTFVTIGFAIAAVSDTTAAAPDELEQLSRDFLFPDTGSMSADGRMLVMTSGYDYRVHVVDRPRPTQRRYHPPAADRPLR